MLGSKVNIKNGHFKDIHQKYAARPAGRMKMGVAVCPCGEELRQEDYDPRGARLHSKTVSQRTKTNKENQQKDRDGMV